MSVVMTVCNGRHFVAEQIRSIVTQLQAGDEIIVVDDGSTDESADLIESLHFEGLQLHRNPRDFGVVRTVERGLRLARGDILFLSDQDDVWLPGKRAAFAAEFTRDEQALVVLSDAEVIDTQGRVIAPSFMRLRGGFKADLWSTLLRNRYIGCAMAVRRSLLDLALPIPPHVPMHDSWLGALGHLRGRVVFLERPYLQYRRHGANLTELTSSAPLSRRLADRFALLNALLRRTLRGPVTEPDA